MRKLIKVGDIIRLEKSMIVDTFVAENIYLPDKPFSKKKIMASVEIGKIYRGVPFLRDKMMERVMKVFEEFGIYPTRERVEAFIESLEIEDSEEFDTSVLIGKYIVNKAEFVNGKNGSYKVNCFKISDPTIVVEFYQDTVNHHLNCITNLKRIGHVDMK